mgnify:CR=1 FL=1
MNTFLKNKNSILPIKSLENNLDIGFASPKYKLILLKRYAKFLDIKLDLLIEEKDKLISEKENKLPTQKTKSALHNKVNYSVLVIILFGFIIYLFNTDLSKSKNQIPDLNEVSPDPETISIETQKEEYIEFADNFTESIGSAEKISDNDDEYNDHHDEDSGDDDDCNDDYKDEKKEDEDDE